jgi:ABC-type sugar transport system substrate-binding protein
MRKIHFMPGLLVCALMLPASVFAGGGKQGAAPTKASEIKIAIVSQDQSNAVFTDLENGARAKAKELGVKLDWFAPETADAVKEAELIEAAANAGAHAIGVVPLDTTLVTTLQMVAKRGITVSLINNDFISFPELAFSNGTSHYGIGYDCGKEAVKYLTDKSKTYTIAVLVGKPGAEAFQMRQDGFEQCLKDNGVRYAIKAVIPGDDDFNRSGEVVEQYTIANQDLDCWYFTGGWPFFLDVKSLPGLARWHATKGHYLFTIDAFPPERPFFEAGLVDGAVSQNYTRMGEMTVEYLYNLLMGKGLPKPDTLVENRTSWYATGSFPVTPENWREEFAKMTPW